MACPPAADRYGRFLWALLLASSAVYFFSINEADNDLWGHVFAGRAILSTWTLPRVDAYSYTAAGLPWVNHEWLAQVVLAMAYGAVGSAGLLLLKLVVGACTVALICTSLRARTGRPHVWGFVGLLTIAVVARGFAIRPQIFSYGAVAVTLALIDAYLRGRRGVVWWAPPLFLVWANLHGGFILGLAILGGFAVSELVTSAGRSFQPLTAWAASTVAAVVNPYGPRLHAYVWTELSRAHPITEWQAAAPGDVGQLVFFGMLALFVGTLPFARGWRRHGWQVLIALGLGVFAVRHQRHTPVFALSAAAPLATQLDTLTSWLRQRASFALGRGARTILNCAFGGLALLQLAAVGWRWQRAGLEIVFDAAEYPTAAVRVLQGAGARANLAVPLDWGAYVLWHLSPCIKVSLDGRFATVFPERVVEDNFAFFNGAAGWRRLLDQYPTEAALVPANSPCPIGTLPGWALVVDSRVARLYVRAGTEASAALPQRVVRVRSDRATIDVFP